MQTSTLRISTSIRATLTRTKSTVASPSLPAQFAASGAALADVKPHQLEAMHMKANPNDPKAAMRAAVDHRRVMYNVPSAIPVSQYPYEKAYMKNCENVIGYMPIPIGVVGPVVIDDKDYNVPFATTEGALISSINRGAKALSMGGGVETHVERVGITRAPILECHDLVTVRKVQDWLDSNEDTVREIFESTTSHGKLIGYTSYVVGTKIHLRIRVNSKDAMGMNMITIGSENIMKKLAALFPGRVEPLTLSGNMCTDKKASAINWILGRGFRGTAVAHVPADVLRRVLHCEVDDFVSLNHEKNFVGSAMANTTGGNNSHAANVVAALYLATGQDIAQVGTSAMCLFNASKDRNGDLKLEVMMPSMELATVGGGTGLPAQRGCLQLTGVETSEELAKVSLATVMAGELSLLAAQCAGHLASAHANLGRAAGGANDGAAKKAAPAAEAEASVKSAAASPKTAPAATRGIHTASVLEPLYEDEGPWDYDCHLGTPRFPVP